MYKIKSDGMVNEHIGCVEKNDPENGTDWRRWMKEILLILRSRVHLLMKLNNICKVDDGMANEHDGCVEKNEKEP